MKFSIKFLILDVMLNLSKTFLSFAVISGSTKISRKKSRTFVPLCLCASVPLILTLNLGLCICASAQPGVWESHGPYTHAQTTAFYADSTTSRLYVATADLGVYVSASGGSSWDQLSAPLDTAHITNFIKINETLFAAQPGNLYYSDDGWFWSEATPPSENLAADNNSELYEHFLVNFSGTLYAGALWGSGLFTSNNNGESWELVTTDLNEYTVSTIQQSGETLFAATLENGVYFTSDGLIWTHCGTILENKSIEHLLQTGGMLLAGGENGLFVCTDGISWTAAPSPLDTSHISMLCENTGMLYAGTAAGLYYSADSAASWFQTLAGEEIHCMCSSGGQHYAGTAAGIFSCPIGTNDWQTVSLHPDPGAIFDLSINQDDVYALSKQGIYKTPSGKNRWFQTAEINNVDQLYNLIINDYYILSYGSRVHLSRDDGLSWETAYPPVEWGQDKILKILETDHGFIAAARGIFHSQDGIDWEHTGSALDNKNITTLESADENFFIGTETDGIFYSSDGGYNWIQTAAPIDNQHIYFIHSTGNKLYSGAQNGLYISENQGADWALVPGLPDTIAVISFTASTNRVIAGTAGQGSYYSADGGLTWSQCSAPLDDGQIAKLFAHLSVVIAGTEDGIIYLSQNNGITWSLAGEPLDNLQLTGFSFLNDVLFISIWDERNHRSGIYRSIDSSKTWTPLNKNLDLTFQLSAPNYMTSLNRLYTCGDGVSFQELDLEAPTIIQFVPVDTSDYITQLTPQFYIEALDADSMIISEYDDFYDASWREYNSVTEFMLTPQQGRKRIYIKVKDFSYNMSDILNTGITLDNLPPRFTGIFLETLTAVDTCTPGMSLKRFNELQIPTADQNWYLGPQCFNINETSYDPVDLKIEMTYWPAGESAEKGIRLTGYQPICEGWPNPGIPTGPWIYAICFRIPIPGSALTNKGLDFIINATDPAGNVSTLINSSLNEPLHYFSMPVRLLGQHLGQSEVLPGGTTARSCRIVSVPFKVPPDRPFFQSQHLGHFGDYGPEGDWMFWSYIGNGTWLNGSDIEINDGSGYFILVRDAKALRPISPSPESELTTTPTTSGVWGEIPGWQLRANDWTLIGNPYRTRIELGQLKLKNRNIRLDQAGTELGIYAYSNVGWRQDDMALEPWSGLAVFLADSSDVIVFANPEEPYSRPLTNKITNAFAKQLTNLGEEDWLIEIHAETDGSSDNENYFGVRSDAQADHDVHDLYEPPRLPGGISVSFPHKDWAVPTNYASDIRAVTDDGYTWPLQVSAEGGTEVSLHFETLGDLPNNFQMWLIDEATNIARDLRTQQQIQMRIPEEGNSKNFRIVVGTNSFVEQNSDGVNTIPSEFVLYQNYPNPFNPLTVIRYALPVDGEVTLQIYDVLGRVVSTPEQKLYREPGYYELFIDMSDLASGIYFYRVYVDGIKRYADVKKMVFLR